MPRTFPSALPARRGRWLRPSRPLVLLFAALTVAGLAAGATGAPPPQDEATPPQAQIVDFHTQVRPILVKHCLDCHGEDEDAREADLRLDRHEDLLADLGGELFVVAPGDPAASYMMERIVAEDDFDRMPPEDYGPRLSEEEVALLNRWIQQGAKWSDGSKPVDFVTEVRPILQQHCFECHGEDEDLREADLRLDTHDGLFADLGGGVVNVVPGKVSDSYMMERIVAEDFDRMPPEDHGPRLSEEEVATLTRWIEEGAKWAEKPAEGLEAPFDMEAELEASLGLPGPVEFGTHLLPIVADRCWTCHGPDHPDPADGLRLSTAEAFQGGRVLAAILAPDPAERMPPPGQPPLSERERALFQLWVAQGAPWSDHWAFLAPRRAEDLPHGTELIDLCVRRALEAHSLEAAPAAQPDRLLRRLCFDLLGRPPTPQERAAYLAEPAYEAWVDRLLASPECAAWLARDWLRTVGGDELHGEPARQWKEWVREAFASDLPFDRFTRAQLAGDLLDPAQPAAAGFVHAPSTEDPAERPEAAASEATAHRVRSLCRTWLGMAVAAGPAEDDPLRAEVFTPRDARSLAAFLEGVESEVAGPVFVTSFLPPLPEGSRRDRLHLAQWLLDPGQPLTARAVVNHYWALLFGRGLVPAEQGFAPGSRASHPELLDALAVDLVQDGWRLRPLLRAMLLSAAYRRSSRSDEATVAADPDAALLSRHARRTLDPAMVLAQTRALGGAEPAAGAIEVDGSEWTELALRNHPYFVDTARAFGTRLLHEETGTIRRLIRGFRECTSREPTDEELLVLTRLYQQQFNRYIGDEARSKSVLGDTVGDDAEFSPGERAAWTAIAGVLLCIDETLHR